MVNLFPLPLFRLDHLNAFILFSICVFFVLTAVYSYKFMHKKCNLVQYYFYIILTAIASAGAVLSNNLILLLVFWGFLGLSLYLLINMGDKDSPRAAKKALIIVGGTDALMILGLAIMYYFAQTFQMDHIKLELNNGLLILAYVSVTIACFAKAGAMPLHSWIPDCAKSAPVPVTAYLPASLDKLLGIYLLSRLSLDLFVMNKGMGIFLMCIGAFTIIAAVMMALVQHNLKKLLGYHAVSQVGYMILGIGTGNPVGIAGGIFHMLNHSVYKSCLFFTAGNVEYRTRTSELDELGGLARLMPVTYISCMIASFSISGIPPFNGFVSKWLIYQGLISRFYTAGSAPGIAFNAFCLVIAMFGSALTLASFMKLLHAVFLGQRLSGHSKNITEVPRSMWLPPAVLAFICIIFGVCAFVIPLKYFIFPAVSAYQPISSIDLAGSWSPGLAVLLLFAGLITGYIIFKLGSFGISLRSDAVFVGGEAAAKDENAVSGIDFYNTVKDMRLLRIIYNKAEDGVFDIYRQGKKLIFTSRFLQYLHNGVLPTYLVWVLLGMAGLFLIFK